MDRKAFTLLQNLEKSWWYRGRAEVINGSVARIGSKKMEILDFGAGFGGMYDQLAKRGEVYAFEPDSEAKNIAASKQYTAIYDTEEAALNRKYDLIGLFDVLEHIEDDSGFLDRAHRALTSNGRLVITVPAIPFLWSVQDVSHHHFRRYTRRTLRSVLENAGYSIEFISYWNTILFFPAALVRLLGKSGENSFDVSPVINSVLLSLIRIETAIMRYVPLPVGISLIVVARVVPK